MKRLMVFALVILGAGASSALAQPPRGGRGGAGMMGGPMMLLNQPSVQQELKISDAQKQQIQEAAAKLRASAGDLQSLDPSERQQKLQEMAREGERAASKVLHRDQMKRLKEITLQVQGARAFSNPDLASALGLTDEQKEKIKAAEGDRGQRRQTLPGNDPEAARTRMEEMRKAHMDKVMNILTPEQKAKYKEMTGEPFTGKLEPAGGRRGQRNQ
jgi:Spy/CpxP family protein refolding chaperone